MKNFKLVKLMTVLTVIGFSLILILTRCTKVKDVVVVQKFAISGNVTFPDVSGNSPARGAVLSLYSGIDTSSSAVAKTFADAAGNYKFIGLLPGPYTISGRFNTVNQNARMVSDGFNFFTNPWVSVNLGNADLSQNISLINVAATGSAQIAMDTINANPTFRKVAFETHSKLDFSFINLGSAATLGGGFNTFQMDNFVFDESNPANTHFSGWTVFSSVTTYEPARDAMGISGTGTNNLPPTQATGCVHGTLNNYIDSGYYYANANTPNIALPITDTARFVTNSVVRYGDGYIAHGTLTAFYKHIAAGPIGSSSYNYKSDTTGFAAAAGHPYNGPMTDGMISVPLDMYFTYSKTKVYSGANFNWWFVFEGQFSFKPITDFYITSSHFVNGPITINAHVEMQGTKNVSY